jgi:chromosome segregation ATPase
VSNPQPEEPEYGWEPQLELVEAPPAEAVSYPERMLGEEALFPRLPKRLVGYGRAATEAVLQQLAGEIRWLEQEWQAARAQVQAFESEAERLEERERAISRSMTLGVEAASRLEQAAWAESEQILEQARVQAEEVIRDTASQLAELQAETRRLETAKSRTYHGVRQVLVEVLERLDHEFLEAQEPATEPEPEPDDA